MSRRQQHLKLVDQMMMTGSISTLRQKDNSVNPESVEEYKVYQFAVLWRQEGAAGEGKLSVTIGKLISGSDDSDLSHLLLVYFSLTPPVIEAEEDFDI